jgi:MazG family protein
MLLELLATMHTLRAPGGCPWDAEQTSESLAPYILEEACEVIEAIESGSTISIADELGDLLLQIVFQAEISAERGLFDFADVAAGINSKLIRRHPHVFSGQNATSSTEDLSSQWDRIKREERSEHMQPENHPLGKLPGAMPALQRAQKLLARAKRANIDADWFHETRPNDEVISEEELGKALLTLVHHAETCGLDAEQVLRKSIRKIMAHTGNKHAFTRCPTD